MTQSTTPPDGRETFIERDRLIFVELISHDWNAPTWQASLYPTGIEARFWPDIVSQPATYARSGGGIYYTPAGRAVALLDGPQTKPLHIDTGEISKPRYAVAYVRGAWRNRRGESLRPG